MMSCKMNDLAVGPHAGKTPKDLDDKGLSMASAIARIISCSQVGEVQHRQRARYVPLFNLSQSCHVLLFYQ